MNNPAPSPRSLRAGHPLQRNRPANVVNLMEALKRSVEDRSSKNVSTKAPAKAAAEALPKKRAKKV